MTSPRPSGAKQVAREQLLLERELRLGLVETGSRACELLGPCAVTERGEALLERLPLERRVRQVRLGLVDLRLGECAVSVELARPFGDRTHEVLARRRSVQVVGE